MRLHFIAYGLFLFVMTACGGGSSGSSGYTELVVDGNAIQANVDAGAVRRYQVNVTAGQTLSFVVQPTSGDPDMALFSSDSFDNSSMIDFSVNWGTSVEVIQHTPLNSTTLYVEVFGYLTSSYSIYVTTQGPPVVNYPPVISNMQLSPSPAYNDTDLQVSATISDPNGDSLTTEYSWSVNGATVAGATSDTLAATNFDRGDTVSVTVSVSDADFTVMDSVTTVIADRPPVISASPPNSVNEGEVFSFQVFASDPDDPGSTFTYQVLYGPSGMQVDTSGVVTWTAHGAIFDTAAEMNYAIRVSSSGVDNDYANTVTVLDAAQAQPIVRGDLAIPNKNGGMIAMDFDNDGALEILVTNHRKHVYLMEHNNGNYEQTWMLPVDYSIDGIVGAIAAHDLNNDDYPEIILGVSSYYSSGILRNGKVIVIDGQTKTLTTQIDLATIDVVKGIAVADTDNDTEQEIVVLTSLTDSYSSNSRIYILSAADLSQEWQSPDLPPSDSIAVGQLDSDVYPEIAVDGGYVYAFNGTSYANEWASATRFATANRGHIVIADIDNNGIGEIIGNEQVFSLVSRTSLWVLPRDQFSVYQAVTAANVDADPESEIIVGEDQWGEVIVFDYNSTTNLLEELTRLSAQSHGVSSIVVGQFDTDNEIEIIWSTGATTSGRDVVVAATLLPALTLEWTSANSPQLDGPFLGGFWSTLALNDQRAVFATTETNSGYSGSRAITLDAAGNLEISASELGSNWSNVFGFSTTDYDSDGVDEIFYSSSDIRTGFRSVYDFVADQSEWTSPADIGVSHAVTHHDMNGDGADDLISITTQGQLQIYDPLNQILITAVTLPAGIAYKVIADDIDSDGDVEIIFSLSNVLYIYGPDGFGNYQEERNVTLGLSYSNFVAIDIGDIDGNGTNEIVVSQATSSQSTISVYNSALTELAQYNLPMTVTDVIIEPTSNARKNIIVAFVGTYYYATSQSYLAWIDPLNGMEVSRSPDLIGQVQTNSLHSANINNDAQPDLLIGTRYGMYLTR